jgi:hypothetical protein
MIASRRVTQAAIRQVFNASGYYEKANKGLVLVTLIRDNEPDARYRQPKETRSQVLRYDEVQDGRLVKVAIVHQFLLPDGTINNAIGLPDPKWLLVAGVIWIVER